MIKPEKISLDSLPSTPYEERRKLPVLKAVYFVVKNKRVIYIGASTNLNRRIMCHEKRKYFDGCEIFYLAITSKGFLEGLKHVEKTFIRYLNPKHNIMYSTPSPNSGIYLGKELLTREETAALLDLSASTLKVRGGDTECLMEIRQTKKVQFNPRQVEAHREAVWNYGKCDGRCRAALQANVTRFRKVS